MSIALLFGTAAVLAWLAWRGSRSLMSAALVFVLTPLVLGVTVGLLAGLLSVVTGQPAAAFGTPILFTAYIAILADVYRRIASTLHTD